ncbi:outer membrane beta-barrel protein [Pedobacter gandavensis]|uniref:outer membrane beta-barrel protein n=1 Tax=Pedobacter gandavensis TaxID=2679963 RepID=UPI00292FE888|nr:outer membrane beta-barrel protein [Pedobacter gandavensis]
MQFFRTLFIAILLAVTIINVNAQKIDSLQLGIVKGILRDTVHNYVLKSATVSIYKTKDNKLLNYQISNSYGEFNFSKLPVNTPLKIEVSHVGYQFFLKEFTIPVAKKNMDLKTMVINPKDVSLQEVVISIPPISMNGDTLEFNASAFKLDSNAVVEDLLRKIPNITVWGDGQITVNGREVKSILVNGKPFFGGDAKIATQNIAKNALEKIQVYNTVKDKTNPLDSTLEVNLKLKKGKDIGYFGKIGAGFGTNKRYESDASFNIFSPKLELAIIGASNNINKIANNVGTLMNNSTFKGVGTNVEYQPDFRVTGLNKNNAAGLSFTYNFIEKPSYEKKNSLTSNYFIQNKNTEILNTIQTTTPVNDVDVITDKNRNKTNTLSTNHRFDSRYDWTENNKTLAISQSLSVNDDETNSESLRSAEKGQNKITSTNNAFSQSNYKNSRFNLNANFIMNQDYSKPSQVFKGFDATYYLVATDNNSQRLNSTEFRSFTNSASDKKFNRKYASQKEGVNQEINLRLPGLISMIAGKNGLAGIELSLSNKLNINQNKDKNKVQDFDEDSQNYQNNTYLSNQIQTNEVHEVPGLNFSKTFIKRLSNRFNKRLTLEFAPKQQFIHQNNESNKDIQNIKRNYSKFLPDASVSFHDNQYGEYYKSYVLSYRTNVRIPNINQLAPLTDSTNLYYLQKGNLNLKEETETSIAFNVNHNDQTGKNILNYDMNLNAGMTKRSIVDSVLIDDQNRRTIYFVNAEGHRYINFYGNIRKAIKFKTSELQLSLHSILNTSRKPGYTNGIFTFSGNFNTDTRMKLDYTYNRHLAVVIEQVYSTYKTKQEAFSTKYSGKNIATNLSSSFNINKNLTLNTNISFNTSTATETKPVNFTIWNANTTYRFLKGNNAEIKLSALDLLRQNSSIINYGNANSFSVGTRNVLEQYFMVTFSYYPRQFGKKK